MEPIIEVKNIGKEYKITHQRGNYIALRDVLADVLKHPFRFLFHKVKKAAGSEGNEDFWALSDVSFTVEKGEVIGIIGPNGAGKSTLLKILSQITPPSTGEITLRGRVSSLLEVGTGFHPELTGRENIFLNAAILGMPRSETVKKFDEIVTFAGVEQFLDTPVKYYSSGMYVRLAFSVAAHIEPDILIVDEVLAVGDAEFQKKCLGKMEEVTKKEGRTILFVSHNLSAIQSLCKRSILLEKGRIKKIGPTHEVIDYYLNKSGQGVAVSEFKFHPNRADLGAHITKISILRNDGTASVQLPLNEPFSIEVNYSVTAPLSDISLSAMIHKDGELLLMSSSSDVTRTLHNYEPGEYITSIQFPPYLLNVGSYFFNILIHKPMVMGLDEAQNLYFEITDVNNPRALFNAGESPGKIASLLPHVTRKG